MTPSRCLRTALYAASLFALPASAGAQTFTFARAFTVGADAVLDVTTARGKITVRAGSAGAVMVTGTATVRQGFNVPINAPALAERTANAPPMMQEGRTIRLRWPADPLVRAAVTIAYEVIVPVSTTLVLVSDSGAVAVTGVGGVVSVRTQSSAIDLADLGGSATVNTGSGDVSLDRVTGAVAVTTKSSMIRADGLGAGFVARSGSGRVTASLAGRGDVDVQTQSSEITVDGADGGLRASSQSGRIMISGTPRAPWSVSTGSASIQIVLGRDASATLDATSATGSVQIAKDLMEGLPQPRRAVGSINGGGVPLRVFSKSGAITVGSR